MSLAFRFETHVDMRYQYYMEWLNDTTPNNLDLRIRKGNTEYESSGNTSQELIEINNPAGGE